MSDPGSQLKKVLEFKEKLEADKTLLFQTFDEVGGFKLQLTRLLAKWLRDHEAQLSPDNIPVATLSISTPARPSASASVVDNKFQEPTAEMVGPIQEAHDALRSGFLSKAETIFSEILGKSSDPLEVIDATSSLAYLSVKQGEYVKARQLYHRDAIDLSVSSGSDPEERRENFCWKRSPRADRRKGWESS